MQVLEQYMVPNIFALVANTPYGERQLMLVRPPEHHSRG